MFSGYLLHREQTRVTRSWEWRRRWVVLSGPLLVVFADIPAAHRAVSGECGMMPVSPLCGPDGVVWALDLTAPGDVEIIGSRVSACLVSLSEFCP